MDRRGFLGLVGLTAATAGVAGITGCRAGAEPWVAANPLHIPEQLLPVGVDVKHVGLVLQTGRTAFRAGLPTDTWGANGSFLGPTLRLRQGVEVVATVTNALPEDTTLHWHGLRVPADVDGGPHQVITQRATWRTRWPVINQATTGWYHPHAHGATAQHVFRGVAGMIIVDDDVSEALALPRTYGVDDLPCILTDRTIGADGSMGFDTVPTFGQLGPDMLVNGTLNAYVDVTRSTVRLRVLNASNARRYHLGFTDDREFSLVATDAGLLPAAVRLSRVALGPAERAEIVVALTPGERATLNTVEGDEDIDEGTYSLLELRAAAQLEPGVGVPDRLGGLDPVVPPAGATVRRFRLQGHDAINGNPMDMMRIDEVVPAGATEIWELENHVYAHNFHLHGAEFSVLDRDGRAPEAYERGRKDTVHLPAKSTVRLAVAFGRYTDPQAPYLYHCHILRHEDDGMMGQYVVVPPGTEAGTARVLAQDQTPSSTLRDRSMDHSGHGGSTPMDPSMDPSMDHGGHSGHGGG